MEIKPMHSSLEPLKFLIGKWKTIEAHGQFEPRVKPFKYCEELEFTTNGQPMLNYRSTSWDYEKKTPLHLESGFLRIQPETNQVSLIVAHNLGVATIEEGTVVDNKIKLKTKNIAKCTVFMEPEVIEFTREFTYKEGRLEMLLFMATIIEPELKFHLSAKYEKVE